MTGTETIFARRPNSIEPESSYNRCCADSPHIERVSANRRSFSCKRAASVYRLADPGKEAAVLLTLWPLYRAKPGELVVNGTISPGCAYTPVFFAPMGRPIAIDRLNETACTQLASRCSPMSARFRSRLPTCAGMQLAATCQTSPARRPMWQRAHCGIDLHTLGG